MVPIIISCAQAKIKSQYVLDGSNNFIGLVDFKYKNDKRLADANFLKFEINVLARSCFSFVTKGLHLILPFIREMVFDTLYLNYVSSKSFEDIA